MMRNKLNIKPLPYLECIFRYLCHNYKGLRMRQSCARQLVQFH